jgi:hypothetical protein
MPSVSHSHKPRPRRPRALRETPLHRVIVVVASLLVAGVAALHDPAAACPADNC